MGDWEGWGQHGGHRSRHLTLHGSQGELAHGHDQGSCCGRRGEPHRANHRTVVVVVVTTRAEALVVVTEVVVVVLVRVGPKGDAPLVGATLRRGCGRGEGGRPTNNHRPKVPTAAPAVHGVRA